MRTNFFLVIAMAAMISGVLFSGCGSSKQMAIASKEPTANTPSQSIDDIDQQIALKKKQMELEQVNAEAEIQKTRQEMQIAVIKAEEEAKRQATPKMIAGNTPIIIPCQEEMLDKLGEYISGSGVSQGNPDIKDANINGILAAKADIEARFIGTIKSSYDYYTKQANVPSTKKMKESELEGLIGDLVHKIVDKEAYRICGPEVQQGKLGGFDCFAVYRIYMKALEPIADQLADKMEVLGVDFDKKIYKEGQDAALKADAEKREKELNNMVHEMAQ